MHFIAAAKGNGNEMQVNGPINVHFIAAAKGNGNEMQVNAGSRK